MTGPSGDPMVDRAIDELRRLPPVDDLAVRRIVAAAAERRDSSDSAPTDFAARRRDWRLHPWIAIGLAAAAGAGFMVRGAWSPKPTPESVAVAPASSAPPAAASARPPQTIQTVASPSLDAAPIPSQFVLRSGAAHRVSVVGDFNNWNPASAPMTRSPAGDLWSITIPVVPGRHMYGFMVDDTLFTLDPRAPRTRDPDLGVEGSVIIVGRP